MRCTPAGNPSVAPARPPRSAPPRPPNSPPQPLLHSRKYPAYAPPTVAPSPTSVPVRTSPTTRVAESGGVGSPAYLAPVGKQPAIATTRTAYFILPSCAVRT